MAKPETTAEDTATNRAEAITAAVHAGTQTLKENIDKTLSNYDRLVAFGKETAAALGQSAGATAKGAETLHDEFAAYSRRSIEASLNATNALFGAKSLADVLEVQSNFARSSFEAHADEMTKLSEIFVAAARESYEPLKGRVQAWLDVVQDARIA